MDPSLQKMIRNRQILKREDQQDATIRCLLLTSVSTCFGRHYAHLQENKDPVTAFCVFWFCWMWLVAVVGRCVVGCDHYEGFCSTQLNRNLHSDHILQDSARQPLPTTSSRFLFNQVEQKPSQCSHPTTQRPTTATNHIQQNQNNTPNAVTGPLFS